MSDFDRLKTRQRAIRDGFPSDFGLRIHRAISWLGRAERETEDPDAAFLFYWIAFNAAYAAEQDLAGEKDLFRSYLQKVVALDHSHRIYDAVWTGFPGPIRMFLQNRFVFGPFWHHFNGIEGFDDWQDRFATSKRRFAEALKARDTLTILSMLFDRLYVLRNQLIHGGATWNSGVNRDQMRDGTAILAFLVPVFIDLMMDAPEQDWGAPFYPVVQA
ncbi:hypothetical protein AVO45_07885 [Ruegeria marisrubri]|uniref:Uncharacterized protein n=1 Tax=Ruegeria marisrubri TaxID=1685379 RepID=A0A0X3TQ75_9RHOB|nr:HEPN domain-containing protein [Ruegeria marisrubri]KUJ77887.1 hypothetical protein AVO45_07885 [Ruegeria marisrubri]